VEPPASPPPVPPAAPADSAAPDPRIGAVLQGRYRILSKLASGAMGVVYRGERVGLGRPVAVKFLHPWIAAQKTFLSRFENEARAMSRLGHPNCVSVIDFGVEGGPYLVMDFVTGKTLRDATQWPQPPARALHIVRQLLAGMAHAHAQGIVHRDLKPENLILTDEAGLDDHLRILDFGLAKLRDGPAMTAGMAVGTPSYMSPEQSGAEGAVDARSDIYSVGVLLFELLAGRKPFEAQQIGELILMHRESPPPSIRALAPAAGISPALEAVVLKALSKRQQDRPQSAAEMAAALDATPEGGVRAEGPAPAAAVAQAPAQAARPGGLPAPPAGRAPRAPEATIVETATAIMRRHDLPAAAAVPAATPPAKDPAAKDGAAASASPAPADAPAAGAAPAARRPIVLDRRLAAVIGGAIACVVIAVVLGMVRHRGSDSAATGNAAGPANAAAPAAAPSAGPSSAGGPSAAPGAPGGNRVEEARRLRHNGEWEQALAVLHEARRENPGDADVDYLLANIYLEHHRPLEGIAAAQSAIRKNPALKSDGDLVNAVIESLASDKTYDRSQAFLRGLGPAATPFVKEAAQRNPSAKVRERAAEILQGAGGQRSAFGSSQHSSSSLFHR
jgi:eukaryotic-like serine/threonine-protein kinase